jgi:hypothetical protein
VAIRILPVGITVARNRWIRLSVAAGELIWWQQRTLQICAGITRAMGWSHHDNNLASTFLLL